MMGLVPPRSTVMFVVISIVVFILAFVSGEGQNAHGNGTALSKAKCGTWHTREPIGMTPIAQKVSGRNLTCPEVWTQSDSDFRLGVQGKGNAPPFGIALSECQRKLLVAHIREGGKKLSYGEGLWQPMAGRLSALDSSS
jgi:hypothetical protein